MMDATTAHLVDFALGSKYSDLSPSTVHDCKRRLIDSFACAFGAYNEPLCQMAQQVARRYAGTTSETATVWGSNFRTMPEVAAFANGVMLRFQDLNDTYVVKSNGHPSDVIPGIISVAEALHADGPSVINAVVLAYDVYCNFVEAININSKGWDQPVYAGLATVLGIGKLMRLTSEQMGNAIALALVPNMALEQTRRGELSAWKGCAAANAARNAVFAASLARDGFSGPAAVFEGKSGLWDIVGRFEWSLPMDRSGLRRISESHIKTLPICYHGQCAALAALEARKGIRVQDIQEIIVDTYSVAFEYMANDPARWAPTNRETADHSLPYVISIALLDGEITPRSFSAERLRDPAISALMHKVKVFEKNELTMQYPNATPCHLQLRMLSGDVVSESKYPIGHRENPIADSELEKKFRSLFRGYGDEGQCDTVLHRLWEFELIADVGDALNLFVI